MRKPAVASSKGAARALALALGGVSVAGCQLVFGLDDFTEGSSESGEGGGSNASTGGAGGQTAASTGVGGASPCGCLDPVWAPVERVAEGDPAQGPLPTACTTPGSVVNLFGAPPTVACAGCACNATCSTPSLTCFSDAACTQSPVSLSPPNDQCFNGGANFNGCMLSAPLTEACDTTGGMPLQTYGFGAFESYCPADGCAACDGGGTPTDCVMAPGILAECPASLGDRRVLYASGAASCASCTCDGSCSAPFDLFEDYDPGCFLGSTPIPSEACVSLSTRRYVIAHVGDASCSTNLPAEHPGTFDVEEPYTVCCRP